MNGLGDNFGKQPDNVGRAGLLNQFTRKGNKGSSPCFPPIERKNTLKTCSCTHEMSFNTCKYMCKLMYFNWNIYPLDFITIDIHFMCKYCLGDRKFIGTFEDIAGMETK